MLTRLRAYTVQRRFGHSIDDVWPVVGFAQIESVLLQSKANADGMVVTETNQSTGAGKTPAVQLFTLHATVTRATVATTTALAHHFEGH